MPHMRAVKSQKNIGRRHLKFGKNPVALGLLLKPI
jgi:hypothetical protein